MANVQLTKDAIEKLNQEAEYLKGSKRAELQEGIEVAKKLSDAEQKEAHDEYAKNESRIAVLEELIDGTFQREAANQTRTAQPVRVTLEGLINLMAELDFLRTTKRQEIKELLASLQTQYPDIKTKIFGAMQRLPLPEWGISDVKKPEKP